MYNNKGRLVASNGLLSIEAYRNVSKEMKILEKN
jgi:hypothetical protein